MNNNNTDKERKWERISKKYSSSLMMRYDDDDDGNENLNKLHLENCNFINDNQMRKMMLNHDPVTAAGDGGGGGGGGKDGSNFLDPILVMNIRHESIRNDRNNRKKSGPAAAAAAVGESSSVFNPLKVQQQINHKKHNNLIEINLVNYEIEKFNKKMCNLKKTQPKQLTTTKVDINSIVLKSKAAQNMNYCDVSEEFLSSDDGILCKYSNGNLNNNNNRHVNFNNSLEIIKSIENSPRSNNCSISLSSTVSSSSSPLSSSTPNTILDSNNLKQLQNQENPKNSVSTTFNDINNNNEDELNNKNSSLIIKKLETTKIINNNKLIKSNNSDVDLDVDLNEKTQIITDLFNNEFDHHHHHHRNSEPSVTIQNQNFQLLKRYFLKWLHFITIQRLTLKHDEQQLNISNAGIKQNPLNNVNCTNKLQQIEYFLKHIRLEKKKKSNQQNQKEFITTTTTTNQFNTQKLIDNNDHLMETKKIQRRIKTQQNIIELQKLKLERQERLIQELRLMKILKENHDASNEVKTELKNLYKTNGITQQSRTTAKCLHMYSTNNNNNNELVAAGEGGGALNGTNHPDDDIEISPFEQLRATGLRIPKFLINMEARAADRNLRHQKVQERREQLQREKEENRLAMEEAKRHQDEETKRQRILELKRKRVQEKLDKLLKEKERLRQIEYQKNAIEFYNLLLLRTFGLNRFRLLMKRKLQLERTAITFYRNKLKKSMFIGWKLFTEKMNANRIKLADNFYQKLIIKNVFLIWKNYHLMEQSKYLVACDWYDLKLINQMFSNWMVVKNQRKFIEELKMKKAEAHFNWHLKWKSFDHWQRFKSVLKIEKDIEERRLRWRLKIWELLPDYTPNS